MNLLISLCLSIPLQSIFGKRFDFSVNVGDHEVIIIFAKEIDQSYLFSA